MRTLILGESEVAFLKEARSAAMVTLRPDGSPHVVRVGVALVDGKLWSSGVPDRLRTRHLRRDPRGAFIVFDKGYGYLTVEGEFRILDGPDAPEQSWRLFDAMQSSRPDRSVLMWYGRPLNRHAFLEEMREARRLIYELTPTRSYGLEAAARG